MINAKEATELYIKNINESFKERGVDVLVQKHIEQAAKENLTAVEYKCNYEEKLFIEEIEVNTQAMRAWLKTYGYSTSMDIDGNFVVFW